MANIKDFIKKIGNETVSLEEQQRALAAVEQTIVEAKAKREESIGKNVDLVISALKKIESDLNTKLVELNNTPAKQGVAGPKGEKGRDGRDGVDGYKGQDGKDGVNGKDGKDGSNGISVTDAKVDFDGSLVITLSDGREIDAGAVLSSEAAKHIHSVQTAGTGSTSQAVLDAVAAIQATIATYGTMATQNANSVAITGGTINGTTIGATTPAAGTFTTITGQTEVLKGTGSNLILNSQGIGGTSWVAAGTATSTQNSAIAPDLTSTASTITSATDVTFGSNNIRSASTNIIGGATYTASCYVKLGTATTCSIALRDNTVGTLVTSTTTTAGSWVRLTATITYGSSTTNTFLILGNANGTFFAWGAQIEFGSTANTYIPTTTTAIYGTPTLSFSGVAGLGLESNGSLYVSPAGTGAIQAQATTSTTVGGNARGANAVDWQTFRDAASKVASGAYSVVTGGYGNQSTGQYAINLGGAFNNSNSTYTGIYGGTNNTASLPFASVVNGSGNTAAGYYNFIGAGFTNSGTSSSAVTTQSGTMNATTAVTLSGSNASIKVGQYITGTSIAGDTYVAAISGTALTLSKNASGSSTSTLSFFTPHGVVVGGGNNQATGSYSFIGGGGDAGTAANRNVASGDWSFVGGGAKNVASGAGAVICGGGTDGTISGNTASGAISFIGGGRSNTASNFYASVLGGVSNIASGSSSSIYGGICATTRGIAGNSVTAASETPFGTFVTGHTQTATLLLGKQTTDATPTALCSNSAAASTTNQVILPNNSAYFFRGEVVSGVTGGGNTKGWTIEGVIKRGANAASTALVGTPTVTSLYADAGAATWALAVTADTTNGGIKVTFTGQAATTIRTVCSIRSTEMTF